MDDAVLARDAAREALADVEPQRLRSVLDGRLATASMTPGVLTVLSARALDPGLSLDGVVERAAGVQLIYEGLRLTRTLAHDEPWTVTIDDDAIDADIEILAADVLVARGFYLLARTEAASRAVETVRAFGRDQTLRSAQGADAAILDRNLESNVCALAVVAGTTAVGGDPPSALVEYAESLARNSAGDLPPVTALTEAEAERIASLSTGSSDRVPSSATDP
ncbi:MAG: DUF7114 family protein [Halobacteriota archaeon]